MRMLGMVCIGVICLCASVLAEKPEVRIVTSVIRGEVSAKAGNSLAVVYERDEQRGIEYEVPVSFTKEVKLIHKNSFDQLQVGDIVEVQFEDTEEEYTDRKDDGSFEKKRKVTGRKTKEIRFIRSQTSGFYSSER